MISQVVSALDEYEKIELLPGTRSNAAFRTAIRKRYQEMFQAPPLMQDDVQLNPGMGAF